MKGSNRRRYFTEAELGKLIRAARKGRWGQRDATLILLMARHGLASCLDWKRPLTAPLLRTSAAVAF